MLIFALLFGIALSILVVLFLEIIRKTKEDYDELSWNNIKQVLGFTDGDVIICLLAFIFCFWAYLRLYILEGIF